MPYPFNEVLYQSILDSSTDLVFLKDSQFKYLLINKANAEFFGKSQEDIVGFSDYDLMPKQNADTCRLSDQEVVLTNKNITHVEKIDSRYWESYKFPVILPDGTIGVGGIIRDITQAKKLDEEVQNLYSELEERVQHRTKELERINQELEAFAYSISHDLRAPLRAIDGFSGLLQERVKDHLDPESSRYLEIVRSNTKRMDQLIKDLLFFSRASRTDLKIVELDMREMVNQIFEERINPDDPRKIKLDIHTLPFADGDASLMMQVWINLIDNALKYSRRKEFPCIEIGSYPEQDKQIYFVRDNGEGFNPAYTNKLFGVFQRLHTSDEFEGTGVGLALVKRILQRHGGDIWAEGKVGHGAKFFFSLPLEKLSKKGDN